MGGLCGSVEWRRISLVEGDEGEFIVELVN